MKLSVIIGIIHMSIGVIVKGLNSVYFGRWLDLVFEVIIGLIIMLGLFGWMDILIFAKWTYVMNPYSQVAWMQSKISYAPSIITVMINNFLAGGKPGPNAEGVQQYFIPGQREISEVLVIIVLISVPLMLLVKPIVLGCCTKHDHPPQEF